MVAQLPGYGISIVIIAIMLSVAGIVYGLGYAFDDKKLKDFGHNELYQSLINGVIVGVLFIIFSNGGAITRIINGSFSNVTYASCPGYMGYNNAICFAHDYLAGVSPIKLGNNSYPSLLMTSVGTLVPLTLLYAGLSLISSIQFNAVLFSVGFAGMMKPLLSQLSYIINAITLSVISIEVQDALLKFIAATGVTILLPVGIVLRTFYFTRKLGGAIIATAIGLFAVFPLTYLLAAEMVNSYSLQLSQPSISSVIGQVNSTQTTVLSSYSTTPTNSVGSSLITTINSAFGSIVTSVDALIEQLTGFIASLIIQIFFLPVFSIILTIISIRELAKVLGSEMSFHKFDIF